MLNYSFGQTSYLYNLKGQLLIDTTFTISSEQFEIWKRAEYNILLFVSEDVEYSRIAKEAGIKGIAIIAFDCDSISIKNIRLIKKLGGGLDEVIIEGIKKSNDIIISQFKRYQNNKNGEKLNYQGTYYIPFDFSLIDMYELIKTKNAIPIFESKPPFFK